MGFYWNWFGAAGTAVMLLGWLLAAFVLFTNAGRRQNRLLALTIFLLASVIGAQQGILFLDDEPAWIVAGQALGLILSPFYVAALLQFLATLGVPWLRWPGIRSVSLVVWGLAAIAAATIAAHMGDLVTGTSPTPYARGDADLTSLGLAYLALFPLPMAVLSLAASISNLRRTRPGTAARTRAKAYLTAFVFHDLVGVLYTVVSLVALASPDRVFESLEVGLVLSYAAAFLFFVLLAYGLLRYQVLDIDLHLKFALRGGTLGAAFLVVFLIVSQLVQNLTTASFGAVAGAVAAGLLLFALRPLERMAHGIANKAMPQTHDTDAYRTFRKMEVYKATVESFLVDGRISGRERDALSRLAAKLGIAASDARAIEGDVAR